MYGLFGTIVTFSTLAALNHVFIKNDLINLGGSVDSLSLTEILIMSSALSSKDSFAAAGMIDHHSLTTLHAIIFGEGLLNVNRFIL